ncbi:MFS transporter [Sandarakinorhabdus sp. DWP1-3-1]|uniref:MFS transporter n=1 Tax=Sandarakinorhabdus sp. DWP1-3-1 TaxID=2804627 RepID=UPI003CF7717F
MARPDMRPAFVPVVTLMALSKVVLTTDFSIVSIALPSIGRDLGVAPSLLSWVIVASSLAVAGLLLVGGRLVDRFGHRNTLGLGLAVFGTASAVAGLAPNIWWLLAARGVQGAAVALISPAAFALIPAFIEEGPLRHKALGVFGVTQGVSLILGLLLGGGIVSALGWRGVFFINLPLIAVALWLTWRYLPRHVRPAPQAIDYGGAVTITLAIVMLVTSISSLGALGLLAPRTLALMAGAVVMFGAFALIEHRVPAPLMPPALSHRPGFMPAAAISLLFMIGVGGLMVLIQVYMQRALGLPPARAGLGTMPYAAAVIIAGNVAPRLLGRFSTGEIVIGAALVNLTGLMVLAGMAGQGYWLSVAPGLVICGLASVSAYIALMGAATGALQPAEQGVGTALLFVCQQLGTAMGASIGMMLIDRADGTVAAGDFRLAFAALGGALALALVLAVTRLRARRVVAAAE